MAKASAFEALLKRDRIITIAGMTVLCTIAWAYILMGAGLGMDARAMTSFTAFPDGQATGMAPMPMRWEPINWAIMVAMWWVMMIAMMAPSATPTILLYARVHRHALASDNEPDRLAPTGAFAATST